MIKLGIAIAINWGNKSKLIYKNIKDYKSFSFALSDALSRDSALESSLCPSALALTLLLPFLIVVSLCLPYQKVSLVSVSYWS